MPRSYFGATFSLVSSRCAGSPLMAAVPVQAQTFSVAWDAPGGTGPAPQVR
jgi:hypothetical protein